MLAFDADALAAPSDGSPETRRRHLHGSAIAAETGAGSDSLGGS